MKRFLLTTILFFLMILTVRPATKLDFAKVDKLTYQCFTDQKWDSVILVGKQALKQGIDYYYLRVRIGISYFVKQEYFPAVIHLVIARKFNSDDPLVADYLYKAYIFTNRRDEAQLIETKNPKDKNNVQATRKNVLEQAGFEGGYSISDDKSVLLLPKPLLKFNRSGGQEIYGIQDVYGSDYYGNLSLTLRILKRLSLSLAYNYLNFSKTVYSSDGRFEDRFMGRIDTIGGKKYIYSFPWVIHDTSFQYKVNQHELHMGLAITLPAGFKILPAFHFIHASNSMFTATPKFTIVKDTGFRSLNGSTVRTFNFAHYDYTLSQKDTSFNNYLVSLMVMKQLGIFNLGVIGSWSDMNNQTQEQAGVTLTYYPLGNLNFYGTSTATGFLQSKETRLLLIQVLGFKITSWCWIEGVFFWGDFSNANILNGSIVYNNSDKIDYKGSGTLTFVVGNHLQLYLIYQYSRNESEQIYHIKTINPLTNRINDQIITTNNPYNINNLIGGLTWKL